MSPVRRRRRVRILKAGLAGVALSILVLVGTPAWKLVREFRAVQSNLAAVDQSAAGMAGISSLLAEPQQLAVTLGSIHALEAHIANLQSLADPVLPICPYFGWVPVVGGDLVAAPHLLSMAHEAAEAALVIEEALHPLLSMQQTDPALGGAVADLVRAVAAAGPQLEIADRALARATTSRAQIDPGRLSPRLGRWVGQADRYLVLLDRGLRALGALPQALGYFEPKSYLVLAQNNQELRATGGFISGVGLVQIEDGRITSAGFVDSYAVDDLTRPHPLPPAALRQTMGAGLLLLRDANWWPDFPTSAETVRQLYLQDQGQAVDGVIALDLEALRLLVTALGSVSVPGYPQAVTPDSLTAMLTEFWQAPRMTAPGKLGADWWLHRKDLLADLMAALLTQTASGSSRQAWPNLADAVGQALHRRHLLLYVDNPSLRRLFAEMGWDGALRQAPGDYLLIVDSNVGFNKVNPNIEQVLDYRLSVDSAGQAVSELVISYRHLVNRPTPACVHEARYGDNYADLMERCYWDHVRIYLPEGSELLSLEGSDTPASVYAEHGHTVVATSFLLETGQARRVEVRYRPAISVLGQTYTLLVQKQAGTRALPIRVSVTLPPGAQPRAAQPGGLARSGNDLVWPALLERDIEVEVSW